MCSSLLYQSVITKHTHPPLQLKTYISKASHWANQAFIPTCPLNDWLLKFSCFHAMKITYRAGVFHLSENKTIYIRKSMSGIQEKSLFLPLVIYLCNSMFLYIAWVQIPQILTICWWCPDQLDEIKVDV